jgi:protein-disulfide isomerase
LTLCDNENVLNLRRLPLLLVAATLASLGCHAQVPATATVGKPLPPALARRVEVLLRQKANLPPDSSINIGVPTASELPGFDLITVSFTNSGNTSHPVNFLVSLDGKTLAQFTKYDISADPRNLVSAEGRPFRGGPPTAPVLIVGFDDLECPYCARLHSSIFPAITQRYGDKVHIVYKDYPLPADMHPWAMRSAVDVNCLALQSPEGYWNLVDYIHAHASEIGNSAATEAPPVVTESGAPKPDRTLARANDELDKLTREQGAFQKVDAAKLDACIAKQDTSAIEASKKIGDALSVNSTPSLFINGDKIDGAVPIEFIFSIIDDALRAQNVTPPPPYVVPAPPVLPAAAPASTAPTPTSAGKPGR